MSDSEEPPAKMSKYTDLQYLEEEELEDSIEDTLDDGQEEWLSEEILTDDDGLPVTQAQSSQDTNDDTSQPETGTQNQTAPTHTSITITPTPTSLTTTPTNSYSITITGPTKPLEGSINETTIPATVNSFKSTTNPQTITILPMKTRNEDKSAGQNIEDTLNELEDPKKEVLDELDKFLIRKTDGKVLEPKLKHEDAKVMSEDNGNDTDDLLRMLGENGDTIKKKNIKLTKKSKNVKDDASTDDDDDDDDDDFVYERSKMKSFKMAKSFLAKKKPAAKADPEDSSLEDDVTDASSDEAETMEKMFKMSSAGQKRPTQPKKPAVVQKIVRMNSAQTAANSNAAKPKPQSNDAHKKSILKPAVQRKPDAPTRKPEAAEMKVKVKTPTPFKPFQPTSRSKNVTWKSDETIDEEEFLEDEDGYELDEEEFLEDSEEDPKPRIPIRRPEQMDEEWPSDAESPSEGGSLYDELPSSDSEDIGNWFSLDIRGERAAEYLPLLGSKAYELLTEEQSQVTNRVSLLRNSLSALTRSAQRQHDELRAAAMALAEVDDTLRAT